MKAYRNTLAGGVALAALAVGSARADYGVECEITDNRGNALLYVFTYSTDDPAALAEVSYSKNGAIRVNPVTYSPLWGVNVINNIAYLESRAYPGWGLSYFLTPSSYAGDATLRHNTNFVGHGRCFELDDTPSTPSAPKPAQVIPPDIDAVPLTIVGGSLHLMVNVGGEKVNMLLDTGATISSISPDLANRLISAGLAQEGPPMHMRMANDSTDIERTVVVSSLTVGKHTRTNVRVSVSEGEQLLGLPVLNAIGKFSIDAQRGILSFS